MQGSARVYRCIGSVAHSDLVEVPGVYTNSRTPGSVPNSLRRATGASVVGKEFGRQSVKVRLEPVASVKPSKPRAMVRSLPAKRLEGYAK